MINHTVYATCFPLVDQGLEKLLDAAGLPQLLNNKPRILIKPNLVNTQKPPITTPVDLIQALIAYLKQKSEAEIILGEGTASASHDTWEVFEALGYTKLAREEKITLIDLNQEPSVALENSALKRWSKMYLPRLSLESFLLSVPVLKAHSLAKVTLTMKNMMGLAPPNHFQDGGSWKKSSFHQGMQEAVADLNRYRCPDFTLLDARIGMAQSHLSGPTCDPPVGKLVASSDPVAIDAYGTSLLGKKWQDIGHIATVNGELGQADKLQIEEIS